MRMASGPGNLPFVVGHALLDDSTAATSPRVPNQDQGNVQPSSRIISVPPCPATPQVVVSQHNIRTVRLPLAGTHRLFQLRR